MECLSSRTVRAPGRPRAISCWMRVSRALTAANSAATKKLVARMKKATMITRKSIHSSIHASVMGVVECRQVYADPHESPDFSQHQRVSVCWAYAFDTPCYSSGRRDPD